MYSVRLLNQTQFTLQSSDGAQIPPGGTWQSGRIGSAYVKSDETGTLNFLDIADAHLPGDSPETWGVLISYQGEEFVGRYEGEGGLKVTMNQFMQATLSGMRLREVSLPAMILDGGS